MTPVSATHYIAVVYIVRVERTILRRQSARMPSAHGDYSMNVCTASTLFAPFWRQVAEKEEDDEVDG